MQRLEVSGAVQPLYGSLGVKGLMLLDSTWVFRGFTETFSGLRQYCREVCFRSTFLPNCYSMSHNRAVQPYKKSQKKHERATSNRHIRLDKKNQLDVTFCILYFSPNSCSTCFGQPCANHQELTAA